MEMGTALQRFERYLSARYPNSSTAKHYVHDIQQFQKYIQKAPRAISTADVDAFVHAQLEEGLTASTVNRRLSALHEFFELLARESAADDWPNPVQRRRHRVKEGQALPRDASEEELARLFDQIEHPRDRAMFRLMLDAGLRVGEVATLQVADLTVSLDEPRARLRVRGKGSQERFVWLLEDTLACVQTWLAERPAVADPAMFVTRRRRAFSVRGIQERLQYYCKLAGVSISAHQLRHSFGRRMAEADMPVTSLAALLGHSQVTTTQTYISGAALEIQADYQAAIERLAAERTSGVPALDARSTPPDPADDVWALAGVSPGTAVSPPARPDIDLACYWEGLPGWLTQRLESYIHARQQHWKPSQRKHHTRTRLRTLRSIWHWLIAEEGLSSLEALRRVHIQNYIAMRLTNGLSPATVNRELSELWALLRYYEERAVAISPGVFRVSRPKEGTRLPRFLSEADYQRLEQHLLVQTQARSRDDLLDRAWFYLLSEAGLRLSEVRDLKLADIDLGGARLTVRQGKGKRDRCLPLSPRLQQVLRDYLPQRGPGASLHLLLYRQEPLNPSLIQGRLQRYGEQAQVAVSPHRLRHTLATRLLNEGMPITSLQRLLGHEHIATTLLYARVHNETVRRDFERAYARLNPTPSLAEALFGADTYVDTSQSVSSELDCV